MKPLCWACQSCSLKSNQNIKLWGFFFVRYVETQLLCRSTALYVTPAEFQQQKKEDWNADKHAESTAHDGWNEIPLRRWSWTGLADRQQSENRITKGGLRNRWGTGIKSEYRNRWFDTGALSDKPTLTTWQERSENVPAMISCSQHILIAKWLNWSIASDWQNDRHAGPLSHRLDTLDACVLLYWNAAAHSRVCGHLGCTAAVQLLPALISVHGVYLWLLSINMMTWFSFYNAKRAKP